MVHWLEDLVLILFSKTHNFYFLTFLPDCCPSDIRSKKNITKMDLNKGFDRVLQMNPVEWQYTDEMLEENTWIKNTTHRGVLAQEIVDISPNSVYIKDKTFKNGHVIKDFHTVDKTELIIDLIASIQILNKRVQKLETIIAYR